MGPREFSLWFGEQKRCDDNFTVGARCAGLGPRGRKSLENFGGHLSVAPGGVFSGSVHLRGHRCHLGVSAPRWGPAP